MASRVKRSAGGKGKKTDVPISILWLLAGLMDASIAQIWAERARAGLERPVVFVTLRGAFVL